MSPLLSPGQLGLDWQSTDYNWETISTRQRWLSSNWRTSQLPRGNPLRPRLAMKYTWISNGLYVHPYCLCDICVCVYSIISSESCQQACWSKAWETFGQATSSIRDPKTGRGREKDLLSWISSCLSTFWPDWCAHRSYWLYRYQLNSTQSAFTWGISWACSSTATSTST